ncbi:MAG TPA: tRNA adenylyltransferase, partial [Mitsuokella multacida]|nr:tRNA adenylyltransferase [Mitsuokella multacida]
DYLRHGERLLAAMHGISGKDAPKELRGRAIGQWLAGRQTVRLVRELTALRATSRLGDAGTI